MEYNNVNSLRELCGIPVAMCLLYGPRSSLKAEKIFHPCHWSQEYGRLFDNGMDQKDKENGVENVPTLGVS